MKTRILTLFVIAFLIAIVCSSCAEKGDCVVEFDTGTGLQSTTTIFDTGEKECEDLVGGYEEEGKDVSNYEWIPE